MRTGQPLSLLFLSLAILSPTVSGGELLTLDKPRRSYAVHRAVNLDPANGRKVATNDLIDPVELPRLIREAESGNIRWQRLLTRFYMLPSQSSPAARAQAYKWAFLTAAQNDKEAKSLIKEFELFMTPEEVKEGRELALAVLKQVLPTS